MGDVWVMANEQLTNQPEYTLIWLHGIFAIADDLAVPPVRVIAEEGPTLPAPADVDTAEQYNVPGGMPAEQYTATPNLQAEQYGTPGVRAEQYGVADVPSEQYSVQEVPAAQYGTQDVPGDE